MTGHHFQKLAQRCGISEAYSSIGPKRAQLDRLEVSAMSSDAFNHALPQIETRVRERQMAAQQCSQAVTSQVTNSSTLSDSVSTSGFGPMSPAAMPQISFGRVSHRQWLLAPDLLRGEVTVLASPGGAGKSSFAIATCIAAVTGTPLLLKRVSGGSKRVLYINAEDGRDEMTRRIWAAAIYHSVPESTLSALVLLGADDWQVHRLCFLNSDRHGQTLNQSAFDALDMFVCDCKADIVVLDPLIAMCGTGNMNDNAVMGTVMRSLKLIAQRNRAAFLVLHHTRKGVDTNSADSIGGASSIVNLSRRALQIASMTHEEAARNGVLPSDRCSFFRIVASKSNLVPATPDSEWYRLISVTLPNSEPPEYPNGDNVQAVERVVLPIRNARIGQAEQAVACAVLALVKRGKKVGNDLVPYSPSLAGAANKRSLLDDAIAAAMTATRNSFSQADMASLVPRIIKSMIADGRLVQTTIGDGKFRRGLGLAVSADEPGLSNSHAS